MASSERTPVELTCEQMASLLTDFFEGDLDAQVETAAIEHVATCAFCDRVLQQTRHIIDIGASLPDEQLAPSQQERLLVEIQGRITTDDDAVP